MIKKIAVAAGMLALLAAVAVAVVCISAPPLPPGTDEAIDEVLRTGPPELVKGTTGIARSRGANIWYESIGTARRPGTAVLLVMGASATALGWPDYFIDPLMKAGYRVIRYDHRGVGISDRIDGPCTLEDMAKDAVAVLDAAGVEKAHVIGISMGGMIAQRLAISYPGRVRSMTSMSSSGYFNDPALPRGEGSVQGDIVRLYLRYAILGGERGMARFAAGFMRLLQGGRDHEPDLREIAGSTLYEMRRRRGFNPEASRQHSAAIAASGSRYGELGRIRVPVLVIHGTQDPIIPLGHTEKYSAMIPGARLLVVDGMGHLIEREHAPVLLREIQELLRRSDR
ncbi:MAG: alpha/beta hydrolase [Spirochaetes bacterium]|nr:alpha/beta hydrolase [Spirochaetota bacterium]